MTTKLPPRAVTAAGAFEGEWLSDDLAVFRGVPFAAPPTGAHRFAPPRPPEPFGGTRPAREFGPVCPQPPGGDGAFRTAARLAGLDEDYFGLGTGPQDEDCLTLNVWTPAPDAEEKRPVMVWFHGGASIWGAGSQPYFDGATLAGEEGVVVVTVNYRLGALGFLGHPSFAAPGEPCANFGILDQVAALEWVQGNAEAFGGDPGQVTAFGESAGGRAILELLTAPRARGLFHRAISQSPWDVDPHHRRLPEVTAITEKLAAELGIAAGPGLAEALRAVPAAELIVAAPSLGRPETLYLPFVDGTVLPEQPLAAVARGTAARVPLVLGWNAREADVFFLDGSPFPEEDGYRGFVERSYGASAEAVLGLYPPSSDPERLKRSFVDLYGDRAFAVPTIWTARAMAAGGATWLYHYTHVHPPFEYLGAFHGAEIGHVLGRVDKHPLDEHDAVLGRTMRRYWANFARGADPNDSDLPPWPATDGTSHLEFGDEIAARDGLDTTAYEVFAKDLERRL